MKGGNIEEKEESNESKTNEEIINENNKIEKENYVTQEKTTNEGEDNNEKYPSNISICVSLQHKILKGD